MATCTYVCEETSREPDNHEGNHHGGGKHRTPVLAGLLLAVAVVYPFRCVLLLETSVSRYRELMDCLAMAGLNPSVCRSVGMPGVAVQSGRVQVRPELCRV